MPATLGRRVTAAGGGAGPPYGTWAYGGGAAYAGRTTRRDSATRAGPTCVAADRRELSARPASHSSTLCGSRHPCDRPPSVPVVTAATSVAGARIGGMTLCDYFSAADDRAAVAVGGSPAGPGPAGFDVVSLKGIDPVVAIARLEAIATDCSYEEAGRRPRSGQLLSEADGQGPLVFSLSDTLVTALVTATRGDFRRFAESWSMTAELRHNQVDAETAGGALEALARPGPTRSADGLRLYCWWAL
ncbi:hypothetical protein ACFQ51_03635 [Streptomyces kaempferi]